MQKIRLDSVTRRCLYFYAALIIMGMVVLPYQLMKFQSLSRNSKLIKQQISNFEKELLNKDKLISERQRLEIESKNLKDKVRNINDVAAIAAYIAQVAQTQSVEIIEIVPQAPLDKKVNLKDNLVTVTFSIEANARYHNLARFLNALEKGEYFLELKQINLKEVEKVSRARIVLETLLYIKDVNEAENG